MRFVLGDRSEGRVTDFDGQLRICTTSDFEATGPERGLGVTISPPLPGDPQVSEAFLVPRNQVTFVLRPGESISVYVVPVNQPHAVAYWADVALKTEDLPKSQEEHFDDNEARFRRNLAYSADGDPDFEATIERAGLVSWAENMSSERRAGALRPDWIERLQSLPGWRWIDESRAALVKRYAEREGHTDVPMGHIEAGVHLGAWVMLIRRDPSIAGADDRAILEAVSEWHW